MRCLIVGTDRLGAAPSILKEKFGVQKIEHWNGRKKLKCNVKNFDLIVIYTGFINHSAMEKVRKTAKKHKIRTIYLNRGLSELACVC